MTPFLRKLGVTLVNPYQSPFELLLLFLTFSVLVANPKKLLYTVANPARGLLNHRNDPDDGESTSCQMQDIKYCFRQYVQSNALRKVSMGCNRQPMTIFYPGVKQIDTRI